MENHEPERGESSPAGNLQARLSGYVANGIRYWEPRRLIYNGVLAIVVAIHYFHGWPSSNTKLTFDLLLGIFFLAVLANIAYSVVYVADIFVQFSGLDAPWRRGRDILLAIGTAFAATITHFFAKGLFLGK